MANESLPGSLEARREALQARCALERAEFALELHGLTAPLHSGGGLLGGLKHQLGRFRMPLALAGAALAVVALKRGLSRPQPAAAIESSARSLASRVIAGGLALSRIARTVMALLKR
jgi:hypothetical protein